MVLVTIFMMIDTLMDLILVHKLYNMEISYEL